MNCNLRACFLILFSFQICSVHALALGMSDISVLIPLPAVGQRDLLLKDSSNDSPNDLASDSSMDSPMETNMPLLPDQLHLDFPALLPDYSSQYTFKELLRVVAFRFDPCFKDSFGPLECKKQIRLIWQPIETIDGVTSSRDAAIHSFYEFSDTEWSLLIQEWKTITKTSTRQSDALAPLQIHPTLKSQGLNGPLWKKMRAFLLKHCSTENLSRITGMIVVNGEQFWAFLGYNHANHQLTKIKIPRIQNEVQGILLGTSNLSEFNGRFVPELRQDPVLTAMIQDSKTLKSSGLNEKEIKALVGRVQEFENPNSHRPGTVDCASCHLAHALRGWAEINYPDWNWQADFNKQKFFSRWPLTNTSEQNFASNQLRMFGYFGNKSVIAQRVVHETAQAMDGF